MNVFFFVVYLLFSVNCVQMLRAAYERIKETYIVRNKEVLTTTKLWKLEFTERILRNNQLQEILRVILPGKNEGKINVGRRLIYRLKNHRDRYNKSSNDLFRASHDRNHVVNTGSNVRNGREFEERDEVVYDFQYRTYCPVDFSHPICKITFNPFYTYIIYKHVMEQMEE